MPDNHVRQLWNVDFNIDSDEEDTHESFALWLECRIGQLVRVREDATGSAFILRGRLVELIEADYESRHPHHRQILYVDVAYLEKTYRFPARNILRE